MEENNSDKDIMNEGNININEKEDNNTNVREIFDNKIHTLNNSFNIRNPYHIYDRFKIPSD